MATSPAVADLMSGVGDKGAYLVDTQAGEVFEVNTSGVRQLRRR